MEEYKTFIEFMQYEVGGEYALRDILDNLCEDEILESVEDYVKYRLHEQLKNI